MFFSWRRLPRKIKIVRILNIIGLIVIVTLFTLHKDRFKAMLDPEGEKIVGGIAPDFGEGTWINSPPLTLQRLGGKVVVLDFWTFKCDNCINILSTLKAWHEKYKGNGVVLVGVHSPESQEEANVESLRQFIADSGIEYPVVTDNTFLTWNRYRAQFWPSTFIIDREGIIREFHYGELGFSSLEEDIVKLLSDEH